MKLWIQINFENVIGKELFNVYFIYI